MKELDLIKISVISHSVFICIIAEKFRFQVANYLMIRTLTQLKGIHAQSELLPGIPKARCPAESHILIRINVAYQNQIGLITQE